MNKKILKILICSDDKDTSLLSSSFHQIEDDNYDLNINISNKLSVTKYDIIVVQLSNKDSNILNQIVESRDQLAEKIIFVLNKSDALLSTTLAKLGFNELFLFPDELFQFNMYITELIENYPVENSSTLSPHSIPALIGNGENSAEIISIAKKVAENPAINLIIYGETGTGKGLLANAIHNLRENKAGPFVEVNCTAIPDNLLESELFGYEKGAFTDAKNRKIGLFELAENGTIFLDEIGDLNLGLQAKLLSVIEKKNFKRLGGVNNIQLKARIISATNRNLAEMVEKKIFRIDLYYRLNMVSIKLLPLRERKDEIILIANSLIERFCKQYNKSIKKIDIEVYDFLQSYYWPGNLREFRNTIEMAIIMLDGNSLNLNYLKNFIQEIENINEESISEYDYSKDLIKLSIDYNSTDLLKLAKTYTKALLTKFNNNKSQTAKILGISRPKLDSLLK